MAEEAATLTPEPPVLAPELARTALVFLDRTPVQGRREAQALLHLCAVLEAISNAPVR